MYFDLIEDSDSGLLGYLLADLDDQEAVLIDPPRGHTELMLALLTERNLRLTHVLRTHVHGNDSADCTPLCEMTSASLVVGEGANLPAFCLERQVRAQHGTKIVFGNEVIRVLTTPGHTPGCVSYLWRDRLFCGDAFDLGGCGAGDSEADPGLLFDTLTRRIFPLPAQTLVFPAHPIKGRRVATLAELRTRYTQSLHPGRDAFITEVAARRQIHAGKHYNTPSPPAR